MTRQAVIFDRDGVLVDCEPAFFALLADDPAADRLPLSTAKVEHHFPDGTIRCLAEQARAMGARLCDGWVGDLHERLYARQAQGTR
ncbi:hypothetical protein RNZ50_05935 [Paracoccaceae bacterium Fryx2]|nr:hypothetical protein [Paracoccaceae bacterium Fryx2]